MRANPQKEQHFWHWHLTSSCLLVCLCATQILGCFQTTARFPAVLWLSPEINARRSLPNSLAQTALPPEHPALQRRIGLDALLHGAGYQSVGEGYQLESRWYWAFDLPVLDDGGLSLAIPALLKTHSVVGNLQITEEYNATDMWINAVGSSIPIFNCWSVWVLPSLTLRIFVEPM